MTAPLRITDHALVRFLERVRGFNLDAERQAIRDICRGMDSGTVKARGHLFEVKGRAVVTVAPDSGMPCRSKREAITGGGTR